MPFAVRTLASLPRQASACAVCFGRTDNADLASAYSWGIGILLGFTFLILAALAVATLRIEKTRAESLGAGGRLQNGKQDKVKGAAHPS